MPVPVFGLLNKHNPFTGYFFYSSSSQNKTILSFFSSDEVIPMEEVERRRRVRSHPYTGCFHFAPGQYSGLHSLRRREEEIEKMMNNNNKRKKRTQMQREYQNQNQNPMNSINREMEGHAIRKDTLSWPRGEHMRHVPSNFYSKMEMSFSLENLLSLDSVDIDEHKKRWTEMQQADDENREAFATDAMAARQMSPSPSLLEKKKVMNMRHSKGNKRFITRRESDPVPLSPTRENAESKAKVHRQSTLSTISGSYDALEPKEGKVATRNKRPLYTYGTHEHDINVQQSGNASQIDSTRRHRSHSMDYQPAPQAPMTPLKSVNDDCINLSCSMGSWQVHNRHGTNGFINKNIKSKAYDHTVKTYEHVTKQPGKISAMSRLREMTLNGEVPSHPLSPSTVPSTCQPKLVDDYRMHLDSPLGEGAYARVFLATCLKTSRPVAIKVVDKEKLNPTQESCVRRELTNQSRLWHHNVVPLLAIYESQKHIYIVLEYCAAGTLEDMLSLRRKLSEEESRYIAFQLITALHYVHSNGILHGDITPANIIFQPINLIHSDARARGGRDEEDIPRVDLLFEKKRREGSLTITLQQAPVVNYEKRSRDGDSESSSCAPRAVATGAETGAGKDLWDDLPLAEMREYLVRTDDIQLVHTERNDDSLPKLRRDVSSGSEKERKQRLGAINNLADTAIRNCQRGKKSSKRGAHSSGEEQSEGSARNCAASWWEHQYIRYKCPYGMVLRVGDFGLCQKIPDVRHYRFTKDVKKAPYTPGGTEGYLPPEVIQKRPYGKSADMWAVGTVLYRCISGAHPFVPNESCLTKQVNFNGYLWKKVSPSCQDFINSLLTAEESLRPSAHELLSHEWFAEYTLISEAMLPE